MRNLNIVLFVMAIWGTLLAEDQGNPGNDPGYWNQNPHRYGNWNRNQYGNQPGAYQENQRPEQQNLTQNPAPVQFQKQNNPQKNPKPLDDNRNIP